MKYLVILMLVMLTACGTVPDVVGTDGGLGTRSGDTSGRTSDVSPTTATALASATGDPVSIASSPRLSRPTTVTLGAPNVAGLNLAGLAMKAQEALNAAGANDPLVVSINAELVALSEAEAPNIERIDALRAQLAARLETLQGQLERMGGSFPALTTIISNIRVTMDGMHPHPELTAEGQVAAAKATSEELKELGNVVKESKQ